MSSPWPIAFSMIGASGATGATGAQGPPGSGSAFTSGSGAPTSAGNAGETYLDTNSGTLYNYEAVGASGIVSTYTSINGPDASVIDSSGNYYVYSTVDNKIFKIDTEGAVTTIAGTGIGGYSGNGQLASSAQIGYIGGMAFDALGNMFIGDSGNYVIRKIDTSGIITLYAGQPSSTEPELIETGDRLAVTFTQTSSMHFDSLGNLFVKNYPVIRKIDTSGNVTTIAGSFTFGGFFEGDGGLAVDATLNPYDFVIDSSDNIIITNSHNYGGPESLVKIGSDGIIRLITNVPTLLISVTVDESHNIYGSYYYSNKVVRISPQGVITDYAGSGLSGYQNGPGVSAEFAYPSCITIDSSSNLYVSDTVNNAIRKISPTSGWTPSRSILGAQGATGAQGIQGATGAQGGPGVSIYNGLEIPSNTGAQGDYFINNTTRDIYSYSNSSWNDLFSPEAYFSSIRTNAIMFSDSGPASFQSTITISSVSTYTSTFLYTGSVANFAIPQGASELTFEVLGGGGANAGGGGAYVSGTYAIPQGDGPVRIFVGQGGQLTGNSLGFRQGLSDFELNTSGGSAATTTDPASVGGGGGAASGIAFDTNRIYIIAGAGAGGYAYGSNVYQGGAGGLQNGSEPLAALVAYTFSITLPNTSFTAEIQFNYNSSIGYAGNSPSVMGDGAFIYNTGAFTATTLTPNVNPFYIEAITPSSSDPSVGTFYFRMQPPQWFLDAIVLEIQSLPDTESYYNRYTNPETCLFNFVFLNNVFSASSIDGTAANNLGTIGLTLTVSNIVPA